LKVLLTGATGFIGSQVARALRSAGHDVRVSIRPDSDRSAIADLADGLEFEVCDLWAASDGELAGLCRGADLCVHAAWYAVPGEYLASPENLRCVSGSLALIDALAAAGCPRVAMVGSCFEYEFGPEPLRESSPVDPRSLYAAAKAATRFMGGQLAALRGMSFLWARPFYQYGPFEHPKRLVPAVMTALLRGERVDVSSGVQVRDFLHVRDVGAALAAAATSELTGVVNVGSGRPVTVREIVTTIESLVGASGLVNFGGRPDNPTDPPFVVADVGRLTGATGWAPRRDLREGLRDTLEWWKAREERR
jgi:nucleoside-diphosphate-sugar epimerase